MNYRIVPGRRGRRPGPGEIWRRTLSGRRRNAPLSYSHRCERRRTRAWDAPGWPLLSGKNPTRTLGKSCVALANTGAHARRARDGDALSRERRIANRRPVRPPCGDGRALDGAGGGGRRASRLTRARARDGRRRRRRATTTQPKDSQRAWLAARPSRRDEAPRRVNGSPPAREHVSSPRPGLRAERRAVAPFLRDRGGGAVPAGEEDSTRASRNPPGSRKIIFATTARSAKSVRRPGVPRVAASPRRSPPTPPGAVTRPRRFDPSRHRSGARASDASGARERRSRLASRTGKRGRLRSMNILFRP